MTDELGKRITDVPGFTWRDGMWWKNHRSKGCFRRITHREAAKKPMESTLALDLDHDANVKPLLDLLIELRPNHTVGLKYYQTMKRWECGLYVSHQDTPVRATVCMRPCMAVALEIMHAVEVDAEDPK